MTPATALAIRMFDRLADATADPPGITRASFGPGEAFAHGLATRVAREMDMDVTRDIAGNLYLTWIGQDRAAPRVMVGSHMDTVHHGGNFDGAAGVVAGLAAVREMKDRGIVPRRDVVVMAIRAEEMVWFPTPYCGSRMAFGLLDPADYDRVRRSDTGRTLADHMHAEGCDPDALKAGARPLDPLSIGTFIEVHIEQGETLERLGIPVGLVNGIRGNLRYRTGRITGRYAHAGAAARAYRADAVLAGVAFVHALEQMWDELTAEGEDFVATVGEFWTDPDMHAITKVPGDVRFTMDLRSLSNDTLMRVDRHLRETASRIGAQRGVTIDPGPYTNAPPAVMAPGLLARFEAAAAALDIPVHRMASGAGHDCATFAWQGIATGMLFIRNQNGSHNPDEAMRIADFEAAVHLLAGTLEELASGSET